jgi:Mn-dependent DtxR family transcriptional regulator
MADDRPVSPLDRRQRTVLLVIVSYHDATGEYPTNAYVARRLGLHHSTIQQHLRALYQRGWISEPVPYGGYAVECWPTR